MATTTFTGMEKAEERDRLLEALFNDRLIDLDRMTGGYTEVSLAGLSGNVPLSPTQATYPVIRLTGNPAAAVTLQIPATTGALAVIHFVNAAGGSSSSVTIKSSGANAGNAGGVTLDTGMSQSVRHDGESAYATTAPVAPATGVPGPPVVTLDDDGAFAATHYPTDILPGAAAPTVLEAYANGQSGDAVVKLGRMVSVDGGRTWKFSESTPFLTPDSGASETQIHAPKVIDVGQYRYLFAAVYTTYYKIVLWVSADGGDSYARVGTILDAGSAGAFDAGGVHVPTPFYDVDEADPNKRVKMMYCGTPSPNPSSDEKIGYAYAAKPEGPYTKFGMVIGPAAGTWENNSIVPGDWIKIGGTHYLFYVGRSAAGPTGYYTTGLATFTNPEGTITKRGQVLARLSSDAQNLTTDLLAGDTTVDVASTAQFQADEYCFIDDGNSEPSLVRIKTVNSATQLTLWEAATLDYTVAQAAKIRSYGYGANHFRTVWREGDSWVAAMTLFLVFQDASHLRELVGFATTTADPPVSGWQFDISRGVMARLVAGSWYAFSFENASVVPARRLPVGTLDASAIVSGNFAASRMPTFSGPTAFLTLPVDSYGSTPTTIAGVANTVYALRFELKDRLTLARAAVEITTAAASSTAGVAVYSADGTTRHAYATFDSSTTGVKSSALSSAVTLDPGFYVYAWTTSNTSVALRAVAQNSNLVAILNTTTVHTGSAANASASGVPPTTLGALSSGTFAMPFVKFEGQ